MNIDFKINDTVKIIGDIQGWTNRTGVIKSIHGVDFIVSCGSTEDYDILVMKREIEHYNPENESDYTKQLILGIKHLDISESFFVTCE